MLRSGYNDLTGFSVLGPNWSAWDQVTSPPPTNSGFDARPLLLLEGEEEEKGGFPKRKEVLFFPLNDHHSAIPPLPTITNLKHFYVYAQSAVFYVHICG